MDKDFNLYDESSFSSDPLDLPFIEEESEDYNLIYNQEPLIDLSEESEDDQIKKEKPIQSQVILNLPKIELEIVNSTVEEQPQEQTYRNNPRRKLEERKILGSLIYLAKKFSLKKEREDHEMNYAKITKNILAFAKKPHLDFIESELGREFIEETAFLKRIKNKNGINLADYQEIYSSELLKEVLYDFFSQKILYRYLMISRTTPEDKIYFLYFLDAFQRNYRKKEFLSLSHPKVQIELEKLALQKNKSEKKKIKKN